MKIILSATTSWNLYNSRLGLANALKRQGHNVVLLSPQDEFTPLLIEQGFRWENYPLKPRGKNILQELSSITFLVLFYLREKPDIVNHFTPKGVIYGSIAANLAGLRLIVNTITGLGYVFSEKSNFWLQIFVLILYRLALRKTTVIFQNPDDQKSFIEKNIIKKENSHLVLGSGIDMDKFTPTKESSGIPVVLLPSRFVEEKGIRYFVEASRLLKSRQIKARFVLVGKPEEDQPTAISSIEITQWIHEEVIEWWGWHNEMEKIYPLAHIVCLPTYYMEGVPKSLIEAAACGRPLVGTDTPGSREIIQNQQNGFLVTPKNSKALADAIEKLVVDNKLRVAFGIKSREIAFSRFSIDEVIADYFKIYKIN